MAKNMKRRAFDPGRFVPLWDFIVCKLVKVEFLGSILVPEISQEGKRYVVVSKGPDCKAPIEIGDTVWPMGQRGVDWDFIPGTKEFFVVRETKVVVKMDDDEEEESA